MSILAATLTTKADVVSVISVEEFFQVLNGKVPLTVEKV